MKIHYLTIMKSLLSPRKMKASCGSDAYVATKVVGASRDVGVAPTKCVDVFHGKNLPVLLFALLVSAPALASLPQVESAWTGVKDVCGKQDFGLHILRKAMLVGLASQQGTLNPVRLEGRIVSGGGVWKTQGSSLTACCGSHGNDRRKGQA